MTFLASLTTFAAVASFAAAQAPQPNGIGALIDNFIPDAPPLAEASRLPVENLDPQRPEPIVAAASIAVPNPTVLLVPVGEPAPDTSVPVDLDNLDAVPVPAAPSDGGGGAAATAQGGDGGGVGLAAAGGGNGGGNFSFEEALSIFRTRPDVPDESECGAETIEFRTLDGTCNNPINVRLGATSRGQSIDGPPQTSDAPTGGDRPSARVVSNIVALQGDNEVLPSARGITEFTTFVAQFLDHNLATTPEDSRDIRFDIPVPENDGFLTAQENGTRAFEFERSARATTASGAPTVQNALSSFIDLSAVYGPNKERADLLRTFSDGKMKVGSGDLLPLNTFGLANSPSSSPMFFAAGDFRSNEHPNLCVIHTVFLREHNKLCDSLKRDFPRWGDERLYQMARKINGAIFQEIIYKEFFFEMTGRRAPRFTGYNVNADPTVSSVFTTAAYRIGHTMVGPDVKRKGANNAALPTLKLGDVFFTAPRIFALTQSPLEDFTRGMLSTPSQEVDAKVVPLLRNFLFSAIEEENVFDLISFNLQRGRDHQLASYNDLRAIFGLSRARSYTDINNDAETADRLEKAYGAGGVDKVDAWIGMMAEPNMRGASMGELVFKIWEREFKRMMDGDRFFFRNRNLLSFRVRNTLRKHGRRSMRDVLLRNLNISPHEMPRNVWRMRGRFGGGFGGFRG